MRILAIETASPPGSIAVLDADQVVCTADLESPRKTTQQFALLIRKLLQEVHWSPSEIQIVAATIGPGSFTGLRIGVTAAKVFAYAVHGKTVGINTLEVIAAQCPATEKPIEVVIDAQRKQLFAARYAHSEQGLQCLNPTQILDADEWIDQHSTGALLSGTGLKRYRDRLKGCDLVDEQLWTPRAATLGKLAFAAACREETTDPLQLTPKYYRQSAAEEKRMQESKG